MTSNPPMTHLERARAWYASNVRSRLNWTEDDEAKISGLAILLAQVTNEAYERAAVEADKHSLSTVAAHIAGSIRSLKEPHQ